jgi:hypothetical protein
MSPQNLRSELQLLAEALEREIPLSQSREMYVRSLANANHARRLADSLAETETAEPTAALA